MSATGSVISMYFAIRTMFFNPAPHVRSWRSKAILVNVTVLFLSSCVKKSEYDALYWDKQEAEEKLESVSRECETLKKRVDELEHADSYALAQVSKLEDSGQMGAAKKAYETFLRSYPASRLASQAQEGLERTNAVVAAEAEKRRQMNEEEARRKAEGRALETLRALEETRRLELSAPKPLELWSRQLSGKSRPNVLDQLGKPKSSYFGAKCWRLDDYRLDCRTEELWYAAKVINPTTGNAEDLVIDFNLELGVMILIRASPSGDEIKFEAQEREAFLQAKIKSEEAK